MGNLNLKWRNSELGAGEAVGTFKPLLAQSGTTTLAGEPMQRAGPALALQAGIGK
jgi:hypothetical protein